jgi:hypothetical protein
VEVVTHLHQQSHLAVADLVLLYQQQQQTWMVIASHLLQLQMPGQILQPIVTVSFSGGGGSGAGAIAFLSPTSIASVIVSSSGQFYTNAPAIEITPGANNSAYATVSLMPYGISGSAMETYLSRVWIVNPATQPYSTIPPGNLWSYSSPGSIHDFATS